MDVESLKAAYRNIEDLAAICDEMASRQNKQSETKMKSFLSLLNRKRDTPIKQLKLIAAFRELERLGCGQYIEGRHGYPSRFAWNVEHGSLAICATAQGQPVPHDQGLPAAEEDGEEATSNFLEHYFNLRVDYQLELTLPVDLTIAEADRLAAFIKSLPLDDFQ